MKRLAILALLVLAACGKHYEFTKGPTRVKITGPASATVGHAWVGTIVVEGMIPEGTVSLVVKVEDQEIGSAFGPVMQRYVQMPPIYFSPEMYLMLGGKAPRDSILDYDDEAPFAPMDVQEEWDGRVEIVVEMWSAEPHPYFPNSILRTKRLCRGATKVLLSCPQCLM